MNKQNEDILFDIYNQVECFKAFARPNIKEYEILVSNIEEILNKEFK